MLSLKSAPEIAADLAARLRQHRLRHAWSQQELARRAGIRPATYVLFERTGRIALMRLIKVLQVLSLADDMDRVARRDDLAGLTTDDLLKPKRQRGRTAR